ncbi:MAG: ArsR/SmtB family transcription factor [Candidatus Thorarchaeota archaeon]
MENTPNTQARSINQPKSASMLVHPITASILRHLTQEEHSLGELAKILGLSKSRISYHLKRLEEENLIIRTREDYYRGGIRKFYRAVFPLQVPRLGSLSPAEQEAQLLPIKAFLWGYLLGKIGGKDIDLHKLTSPLIDEYAQEIAETIEKRIDEGEAISEVQADFLYLSLLYQYAELHLKEERISIEKLRKKLTKSNSTS